MTIRRWAGYVYALLTAGVVAFQIALALGAPWGDYAMGGAFPGQYPPPMRVAAVVQALLLTLLAAVVLSRAGIALRRWALLSRTLVWVIVVLLAVGIVLNLITPSGGERLIWAPVVTLMFVCALLVASGKSASAQ